MKNPRGWAAGRRAGEGSTARWVGRVARRGLRHRRARQRLGGRRPCLATWRASTVFQHFPLRRSLPCSETPSRRRVVDS